MSFLLSLLWFALVLSVLSERARLRAELRRVRIEAAADRQAASNAAELRADLAAIEGERAVIVKQAAAFAERVRVLENALREILPTVRKTAEEYRTGSGKPIPCDAWGAVASIEQALGIESED